MPTPLPPFSLLTSLSTYLIQPSVSPTGSSAAAGSCMSPASGAGFSRARASPGCCRRPLPPIAGRGQGHPPQRPLARLPHPFHAPSNLVLSHSWSVPVAPVFPSILGHWFRLWGEETVLMRRGSRLRAAAQPCSPAWQPRLDGCLVGQGKLASAPHATAWPCCSVVRRSRPMC